MKTLLIPFLLIAAVATASAHCGTCGAGEAAHDKAAKVECAKDKACDKSDKACDKSDKACDKSDKACKDACAKPCCAKEEAKAKSAAAAPAPAAACCAASKAKS